jgi:hypothetical protein
MALDPVPKHHASRTSKTLSADEIQYRVTEDRPLVLGATWGWGGVSKCEGDSLWMGWL